MAPAQRWHTNSWSVPYLNKKREREENFQNSFYEVIIMLISKPDKTVNKKQNYRTISLINIGANTLNKMLATQIQEYVLKIDIPWSSGIHSRHRRMVQHLQITQHDTPY